MKYRSDWKRCERCWLSWVPERIDERICPKCKATMKDEQQGEQAMATAQAAQAGEGCAPQ